MVRRTTKFCWRAEFIGLRRIGDIDAATLSPTNVRTTAMRVAESAAAAIGVAYHGPLSTA
jgi:hypothetical protein